MGNYSLKNILLGVGIGLVFSSIINIGVGSKDLTVEDIKKEAIKHNLIVLAKEDIVNRQSPENNSPEAQSPTDEPLVSDDAVTVNIERGMSSEKISELLKDKGIINDTEAFLKRLNEHNKENILKMGSYKIPRNLSNDEIINILTK